MDEKQQITAWCQQFRTAGISTNIDQIITEAENEQSGYWKFTHKILEAEAEHRYQNELKRSFKAARLPKNHDLDSYDETFDNGIKKIRVNQLRELGWLDQIYNLMFMGPSGTGKTFLAAGLCADAVKKGYKAYFRTMDQIMTMLKMKDLTRTAMSEYKRLSKASLIVIDDLMMFPIEKKQSVDFFNFINQLFENTAFIITTNKMPSDWAKVLDDEVLATALLDRIMFQCEIINLDGQSYRMKNRKSFFENDEN